MEEGVQYYYVLGVYSYVGACNYQYRKHYGPSGPPPLNFVFEDNAQIVFDHIWVCFDSFT